MINCAEMLKRGNMYHVATACPPALMPAPIALLGGKSIQAGGGTAIDLKHHLEKIIHDILAKNHAMLNTDDQNMLNKMFADLESLDERYAKYQNTIKMVHNFVCVFKT